jgi:hypothetical protein
MQPYAIAQLLRMYSTGVDSTAKVLCFARDDKT